ncbi:putative reverse transcriptase domain-containing protein [Tanacetum coccineum]
MYFLTSCFQWASIRGHIKLVHGKRLLSSRIAFHVAPGDRYAFSEFQVLTHSVPPRLRARPSELSGTTVPPVFVDPDLPPVLFESALKGNGANPKGNGCFECGAPGHFKRDCPKLKNKDGGNGSAQGWVYAVGNAEKKGNASRDPDSNVITGTFLLNNHYASILFDTGADRSFISTAFSSLINIAPTPLENSYDVELADGKIVGIDTIIRGCTLNFLTISLST